MQESRRQAEQLRERMQLVNVSSPDPTVRIVAPGCSTASLTASSSFVTRLFRAAPCVEYACSVSVRGRVLGVWLCPALAQDRSVLRRGTWNYRCTGSRQCARTYCLKYTTLEAPFWAEMYGPLRIHLDVYTLLILTFPARVQ